MPVLDLRGGAFQADTIDFGRGLLLRRVSGPIGPILQTSGAVNFLDIGPHAMGQDAVDFIRLLLGGSFTSRGSDSTAEAMRIQGAITGTTGDTTLQTGLRVRTTHTTQGASETITRVSQLDLSDPDITVGSGDTVTNAVTLYVQSAPTEATNNYSLWVDAGATRIDGGIVTTLGGTTYPLTITQETLTVTDKAVLHLIGDDQAAGVSSDSLYMSFSHQDDSNSDQHELLRFTAVMTDASAASVDARFDIAIAAADALATRASFSNEGGLTLTRDAFTTPTTMVIRMATGTFGNGAVTTVNGSTQLPANSLILGVNTEVTTTYTTTSGLEVGESGDPNRWGTGILTDGDKLGPADYAATIFYTGAAADVVCADVGGNENMVAGACTYVIYYIQMPELGV